MRARYRHLLFTLLLGAGTAQTGHGPQPPLPTLPIQVDGVTLTVEVADEAWEREHGLMRRDELPDGRGMLFVYRESARRVFWMRDTTLSLDAAFVTSDGRIDEIVPLEPLSEAHVTSRRPVRYVLEVPRGWFAARGLGPGSRITGLPGE